MDDFPKNLVCRKCKSTKFRETADGFLQCEEGHVLEGYVQEGEEDGLVTGVHRKLKRLPKRSIQRKEDYYDQLPQFKDFWLLLALQRILKMQVSCLIQNFAVDPQLETIVGLLWQTKVKMLEKGVGNQATGHCELDGGSVTRENSSEPCDEDDDDRASELSTDAIFEQMISQGKQRAKESQEAERKRQRESEQREAELQQQLYNPPKLHHTLVICAVGLLYLRAPIILSDLRRWVRNGQFPYMSAHAHLPERLVQALDDGQQRILQARYVPLPKLLQSSLYQFVRRLRLAIPDIDLPPINAPMVLYKAVRELHLPTVIFGLTMELVRLCQPNTLILEGKEAVGPEVNLFALLIIAIKLCYGLDESTEERDYESFFATLPKWKYLSRGMTLALEQIQKIPWSPDDLKSCTAEKFQEYIAFCRDHAFLALKSKPVAKSVCELFEKVASLAQRPMAPSSQSSSPIKKNLMEAKLPRTIEEALPAKNYVVYDVTELYGRFHLSYQFVLDCLSSYSDLPVEELHKVVLKFESKLYEMQ